MVTYEVNLAVDREIAGEYAAWLKEHVGEMLDIEGFLSSDQWIEESEDPDRIHFCIHYRLASRRALEDYFERHAERMRGDGLTRYQGRFSASRRILREAEL